MKKYLLVLLFGIIYFTGYSQDEQIYYKIIFDAYPGFPYPCNDGDDGYEYEEKSQTSNVKFIVEYSEGTQTFNNGTVKDFTDGSIKVKAFGSASVTYDYKGSTYTESADFDTCGFYPVSLGNKDFTSCDESIFELTTEIDDADCGGGKRLVRIICRLYIMPYKRLLYGNKLCTEDNVNLKAYDSHTDIEWFAKINDDAWFSLELYGFDENIIVNEVYDIAPKTVIIDDSGAIPPRNTYISQEFEPGDIIQFKVDHGCYGFESNMPKSNPINIYASPENPDYITPNSPTCTDGLDGSFSIGLINGLSPTKFNYSIHKVDYMGTTKPTSCDGLSYGGSAPPIEDTENIGHWYCVESESGNIDFIEDENVEDAILNIESATGDLSGISAGDWAIYIRLDAPDTYCENFYIRHINDPPQPALTSIVIPTYTYSNNEYNLPYQGASETVTFNYENGTLTNDIIIGNGTPVEGGENSGFVEGLEAGTYGLEIKDEKGCPFNITDILGDGKFTLTQPGPLTLEGTIKEQVSCHHENVSYTDNGRVQIQVSGGVGLYEITLGGTTKTTINSTDENIAYKLDFENLAYGFHPYEIKTENYDGETLTGTIFIEEPDPLELWIDDIKDPICFPTPDGEIKFHGVGGTPVYNFFLNEVEKISGIDETNINLIGGLYIDTDYTLKIKDINDCITEFDFRMEEFANPLEFSVLDTYPPKCIGGDDGKLILIGTGGHDAIYDSDDIIGYDTQKSFNIGNSTIEISDLESGVDYPVTILDSENCQYFQNINIEPNPNPVLPQITDSMEIQCNGYNNGWIEITGEQGDTLPGGYGYYLSDVDQFTTNQIDLGDTSLVKSGNNTRFYNLTPGSHTVYISDTNDCLNPVVEATRNEYKTNFYVYEPEIIKVNYNNTGVSQKGEADAKLWFTATGGNQSYHFELESADTLVAGGSTNDSILIDNLAEGEYTLKIKDTCDCANGGVDLEWITYRSILIKSPNEYLSLQTGDVNPTSCYAGNDGSVTVYGQGGWKGTGYIYGIDSVDQNTTGIFENLASAWYLFHVKDSANVIVYDSIFVPQPELLEASIKNISNVQCHKGSDGKISLSATGGIKPYEFSIDGSTWQPDSVFTDLAKNNYTLQVKDAKECETTITSGIDHPEPYSVSSNATGTLCGEPNGSIECNVSGGTSPYTFQWTTGESIAGTEPQLSNLYSGEYKVTITDAHSCDTLFIVGVSNTDGPKVNLESIDTASCNGQTDGAIHYSISEGITPYNIKLYTGNELVQETLITSQGTYTFENLESNTYKIIVSDFNNCFGSINTIILPEPETIELIADTLIAPVCNGYSNGEIRVHATGGNGNYTYQWNAGESTNRIDNLISGSYSVTTTDLKGCFTQETYELINPEKLSVEIGEEEVICEGQIYPLSAQGFNTYNWLYNGESISSASEIEVWAAGEYVLQVSDLKGCLAEDTFQLSISNDILEAEILLASEVYENDTVVAIDISWPEPEHVEWSFSSGIIEINSEKYIEEIAFTSPGIYTVSLTTYKAMCVDSVSKQIVVLADTSRNEKSILGANPLIKTFKVYPNPNNGQFSVQVELDYTSDITLDLYSIQQNRLVFRQTGSGQSNYNIEYGFTNLQQGVYLVILYVENEKRTERILIF